MREWASIEENTTSIRAPKQAAFPAEVSGSRHRRFQQPPMCPHFSTLPLRGGHPRSEVADSAAKSQYGCSSPSPNEKRCREYASAANHLESRLFDGMVKRTFVDDESQKLPRVRTQLDTSSMVLALPSRRARRLGDILCEAHGHHGSFVRPATYLNWPVRVAAQPGR